MHKLLEMDESRLRALRRYYYYIAARKHLYRYYAVNTTWAIGITSCSVINFKNATANAGMDFYNIVKSRDFLLNGNIWYRIFFFFVNTTLVIPFRFSFIWKTPTNWNNKKKIKPLIINDIPVDYTIHYISTVSVIIL